MPPRRCQPTAQAVAHRCGDSGSIRIRLDGLERTFVSGKQEVKALGPLDLDVAEGEFLCIVGPSGCGKSTLLRVLAGLIKPTAGRVEIAQEGSGHAPLAMVFQDHGVYPWKTVAHNVRLGLDLTRPSRSRNGAAWSPTNWNASASATSPRRTPPRCQEGCGNGSRSLAPWW